MAMHEPTSSGLGQQLKRDATARVLLQQKVDEGALVAAELLLKRRRHTRVRQCVGSGW